MKNSYHALFALRRLHAEIGGKILDNRKAAKRLREDKKHVAAVIKMFSPGYDLRAIPARRQYAANAWFRRGTLFRTALDVMRVADKPLTVRQIVERMMEAKGIVGARKDQVRGLQAAVLASLRHRKGKSIETVGEGVPARWRITLS